VQAPRPLSRPWLARLAVRHGPPTSSSSATPPPTACPPSPVAHRTPATTSFNCLRPTTVAAASGIGGGRLLLLLAQGQGCPRGLRGQGRQLQVLYGDFPGGLRDVNTEWQEVRNAMFYRWRAARLCSLRWCASCARRSPGCCDASARNVGSDSEPRGWSRPSSCSGTAVHFATSALRQGIARRGRPRASGVRSHRQYGSSPRGCPGNVAGWPVAALRRGAARRAHAPRSPRQQR
jgi:hypothetical protein